MPRFIQTITFSTGRIEDVRALAEQVRQKRAASGDAGKPVAVSVCADRDVPNRYVTIVEFSSYEDAMANSNHPDTHEMSQQMAKLCDGPPTFLNLDVLEQYNP